MTLRVPLTLTIIPALTVSVGGQSFAIPRSAIEEIVRANGESVTLEQLGGAGVATIRGRRVPEVVACRHARPRERRRPSRTASLIVLRPAGGDVYALAVDRIHDHEELVVKPAAPAVMATGLYAGTTLADDGSPILLFDRPASPRSAASSSKRRSAPPGSPKARSVGSKATPVLLFRGLDGGRRAIRLAVVDRIEEVPAPSHQPGCGPAPRPARRDLPLAGATASWRRKRSACSD